MADENRVSGVKLYVAEGCHIQLNGVDYGPGEWSWSEAQPEEADG